MSSKSYQPSIQPLVADPAPLQRGLKLAVIMKSRNITSPVADPAPLQRGLKLPPFIIDAPTMWRSQTPPRYRGD